MTEIVTRADNTVTIAEAARLLGMSISTARRAEKAGTFPLKIIRTKSWVRVLRRDLDAYLGNPPQPQPSSNPTTDPLLDARIAGLEAELAALYAHRAALTPPTPIKEVPMGKRRAA